MTNPSPAKHFSSRPLPYTTKTGIQIGIAYEPPRQKLTPEGEFMQSVLLGDRERFSPLGTLSAIAYAAVLVAVVFLLSAWSMK